MKDAQQDVISDLNEGMELVKHLTKCPADQNVYLWIQGMVRLDDPVVTGLVAAVRQASFGYRPMHAEKALSAYEARVKEVEK